MRRILPVVDGIPLQHRRQVLRRRVRVPKVELHQLPFLEHLADGQHPAALVHPHHVADQEVPLLRLVDQRVHHHTKEQRVLHQVPVFLVRLLEQPPQHVDRLLAVQFHQEVPVAAGDAHRLPDRPAPLRHHRLHHDVSRQRNANRARVVVIPSQEQPILTRTLARAGQPAYLGGRREGVVHPQQQVLRRERHRVHQQHELRLVRRIDPEGLVPLVWPCVQAWQRVPLQSDRVDVHARQAGRSQRHRRLLLHLGSSSDDAAAGAAQHQYLLAQHFAYQLGQRGVVRSVLGRCENHRQVGGRVAQVAAHRRHAFRQRRAQCVLLGYGGSPLHDAHLTGLRESQFQVGRSIAQRSLANAIPSQATAACFAGQSDVASRLAIRPGAPWHRYCKCN